MPFTIFYNDRTPFQGIKTKSSKSRKIDIFPKGLTHGFGPKMAIFPNFFFQAIQARTMSVTMFYNDKTPFQAIKCLLRYSRTKKTRFQAVKTKSSKSRKIDIFAKGLTHGLGLKMAIFPNFFFLGNIGQDNVFHYILEQKKSLSRL